MKRFFSTNYSAGAFNAGMFLLRLIVGVLMMTHGYDKLVHFNELSGQFMSFLGLGSKVSLILCIFAEFFCSILLIIGLFTRLATIPLIITMCVIIFMVNKGNIIEKSELVTVYLGAYLLLLFVGPGRISVDSMIKK